MTLYLFLCKCEKILQSINRLSTNKGPGRRVLPFSARHVLSNRALRANKSQFGGPSHENVSEPLTYCIACWQHGRYRTVRDTRSLANQTGRLEPWLETRQNKLYAVVRAVTIILLYLFELNLSYKLL